MRALWKPSFVFKQYYWTFRNLFFFFKKNLNISLQQKQIFLSNSIYTRNSIIFPELINLTLKIYNGKEIKQVNINNSLQFYHKSGEFFLTRKRAVFKLKKLVVSKIKK